MKNSDITPAMQAESARLWARIDAASEAHMTAIRAEYAKKTLKEVA